MEPSYWHTSKAQKDVTMITNPLAYLLLGLPYGAQPDPDHPPTDQCPDPECWQCALRDCPHRDPLHYHHDGCPSCYQEEDQ